MTPASAHTAAERAVVAAEHALLTKEVRADRALLEGYLADDFHEFGVSGREWDRADIIEALLVDSDVSDVGVLDPRTTTLGEGLVLLEYVSTHQGVPRARRTSIWRLEDGRWRMVHHQGSPYA